MKARESLVFLVCAASAFLALPVGMAAGRQLEVHPGGMELRIPLGAKHKFFLSLSADDSQRVKLLADELFSSATYSVEGQVSSSRVEADFGPLGKVDVRIHLRHDRSSPAATGENCSGRPTVSLPGTYRGTIEFAGEREIPALHFKHGPVTFIRRFRRVCVKPQLPSGQGENKDRHSAVELGVLNASSHEGRRTTQFQVFDLALKRNLTQSFGILLATIYERLDQVRIERSTFGLAGGKELLMSKRSASPETFKVKLEEPFSGKAVFSRNRESPSTWTGDLAVKLPGAHPVPLTGPGFSASLCRASSPVRVKACLAESNPRLLNFRNDFFYSFLTHSTQQ